MSNSLIARTEIEMIGIREHNLTPDLEDMILVYSFHACLSSDRHENRGLYIPVWSRESSRSCESVSSFNTKIKHKNTVPHEIIRTVLYEKNRIAKKKFKRLGIFTSEDTDDILGTFQYTVPYGAFPCFPVKRMGTINPFVIETLSFLSCSRFKNICFFLTIGGKHNCFD